MNYNLQLQTNEWRDLRQKLLTESGYKCKECGNNEILHRCVEVQDVRICYSGHQVTVLYEIDGNSFQFSFFYSFPAKKFGSKKIKLFIEFAGTEHTVRAIHVSPTIYKILIEDLNKEIDETKAKNYWGMGSHQVLDLQRKIEYYKQEERRDTFWHKGLQIHHRYYLDGKTAWQYPLDAFEVLCTFCHADLHKNNGIEVRDETNRSVIRWVKPWRDSKNALDQDEYNDLED